MIASDSFIHSFEDMLAQALEQKAEGLRPQEQVRAYVPHICDATGHLTSRSVAVRPARYEGGYEVGVFGFRPDILTRIFRTGGRVTPEKVITVRTMRQAVNTVLSELGVH